MTARRILRLPPRCRATCALVFLGGLTQREAAGRLGVSEKAVQKQVARGRRYLRDLIASADDLEASTFVDGGE